VHLPAAIGVDQRARGAHSFERDFPQRTAARFSKDENIGHGGGRSEHLGFGSEKSNKLGHGGDTFADNAAGRAIWRQ